MGETRRKATGNSEGILSTKLMPPRLPGTLVARPALFERLDEGLSKKLTLVVAPTGFGKTTLVSQWLASRGIPSAWLRLDESDNDPVRFWGYVITALRGLDPSESAGKVALGALRTARQPSLVAILTGFINELAELSGPCVLVLEDYHAITSAEIRDTLVFLLNHMPESLHLLLITRSEPDLPLGILRARNELTEVDTAALRFTRAEIAEFLRTAAPMALPDGVIGQLESRTEGWAAGLRLAALALQGNHAPSEAERLLAGFSGSHRYVQEYLLQEVFANLPETTQAFLLRTSVLERFCAGLCEELLAAQWPGSVIPTQAIEHPQLLLDQLERANLFITRLESEDGQPWYRYHPLFAEALRYRARQELGEAAIQELYQRAGRWYERRGVLDEAVEYLLSGARLGGGASETAGIAIYERAARLIERLVELRDMSELYTLRRWAGQIPKDLLRRYPLLSYDYAQAILFTEDRYSPAILPQLEPLLRVSEAAWRAAGDDAHLGDLLSTRGTIALWQGKLREAFDYARQALERLPEDAIQGRAVSLLTVGIEDLLSGRVLSAQERMLEAQALFGAVQNPHGMLAAVQILSELYFMQGDMEPAGQLDQQVMEQAGAMAAEHQDMLDDLGSAWLGLGRIAYEQNALDTAEPYARQAMETGEKRDNEQLLALAAILLAQVEHARDAAVQARERLLALAARVRRPDMQREVQTAAARLVIPLTADPGGGHEGERAALQSWQAVIAAEDDNIFAAQKERETLTLARLRIAERQPAAALALLDHWREDAAAQGRVRSVVEILCLEALAYRASGDPARAARALTRALTIAQPKGFRRLLLDQGQELANLLGETLPSLARRPVAVYAAALRQAFALEQAYASQPYAETERTAALVEPLSPQELRVLRLLAAGLSNPEIARELVVSTNTIKTQVQSIYRKLNITSREEARLAARELKLI